MNQLTQSQSPRWSRLFPIEHSPTAYFADFVVYGLAIIILLGYLLETVPMARYWVAASIAVGGLLSWSLLEYSLHRFVLHGLEPFKRWHLEHHQRPTAFICASTFMTLTFVAVFMSIPILFWGDLWHASAFTVGLLIGYQWYAITHHAIHHWTCRNGWLRQRKFWHSRHHGLSKHAHYGVTSGLWDVVFATHQLPTLRHFHHYASHRLAWSNQAKKTIQQKSSDDT